MYTVFAGLLKAYSNRKVPSGNLVNNKLDTEGIIKRSGSWNVSVVFPRKIKGEGKRTDKKP